VRARPDFLVIGAMKCATSTLHDQLGAQPGIFMSDPKEPNFFSDDDQWERGWPWYEGLFAPGAEAQLRGESSTHYTKLPTYPDTVRRIRECLPRARFVYVMRDPVERLVSQFVHEWSDRTMRGSLDEAIDRYPRLLEYSRYAMQLRPYLEAFGPAHVLPVFFEAIRARPQTELERIARFLGFATEVTWQADLGARNVSRDRLRRSAWRDALVHQPQLAALRRRFVPESVRGWIKDLWRTKERPTLSQAVRKRVESELDTDLNELSEWLGVRLHCGSFAEVAATAVPRWTEAAPGASRS
jgi:hypothetical protein